MEALKNGFRMFQEFSGYLLLKLTFRVCVLVLEKRFLSFARQPIVEFLGDQLSYSSTMAES